MSMNMATDDSWMPEPELLDMPPRRIAAFEDYPDRNRPNATLFGLVSVVLVAAGFLLFGLAVSGRGPGFLSIIGIVLLVCGFALFVYVPYRLRTHLNRCEHLVTQGAPVMARIISSDNLNNDLYARTVRYQVALPGGDLAHRTVYADDRVLPKRIPSNVTALMDMNSGDVELYCVLPFRAVARQAAAVAAPAAAAATPAATQAAPATPQTSMGTIAAPAATVKRDKPKEEEKTPKRETFE